MAIQQVFYKLTGIPVTGTINDDLIYVDLPAALTGGALNGNDGTDTLRITATVAGSYVIGSSITNVEIVEISATLDEISSSTTRGSTSAINVDASAQSTSLTIYGNDGSNEIRGGTAADTLYGYGGNDVIYGNGGADVLYGGDGDDLFVLTSTANLSFGLSDDQIYGEAGTDKLVVAMAADTSFSFTDSTILWVEEVVLGTVSAGKMTADYAGSHLTASALT
ncbi:MAG: calcium-binding protein, partial [Methylococcaceae bacterium]